MTRRAAHSTPIAILVSLCMLLLLAPSLRAPQAADGGASPSCPGLAGTQQPEDQAGVKASVAHAFSKLPLAFIENRGQLDPRVRFHARRAAMTACFTDESFVLQLVCREKGEKKETHSGDEALPQGELAYAAPDEPLAGGSTGRPGLEQSPEQADEAIAGASIFLTFEGAASGVIVEGMDPLPGRYNYLLGNDPSRWRTEVPAYASIRYRGLYRGVDVEVRDQHGRLEYDLLLEPGADLDPVIVRCEGAQSLGLDEEGTLVVETAAGPLKQPRPCTYEVGPSGAREAVECSYRVLGADRFGFDVPGRDLERALVIDPGLLYATFLGGSDGDWANAIAVDASGAALITGWTSSSDFPTTPGAYDTTKSGYSDAFVAKIELWTCENAALWWNYGSGWPGSYGVPCLIANNDPAVCFPLALTTCNSFGSATTAFLFLGLSAADLPTPWDGRLLVQPDWVFTLPLPSGGASTLNGDVPCDPAFCGAHLYLQVLELDPGASQGVSFTPGLELILGG
ncbi:MAG: SBBP repeat-containing protein [Planctomycetota bacterium]